MGVRVVGRAGFDLVWSSVQARGVRALACLGLGACARVCAWARVCAPVCACVRLRDARFDNLSTPMTLCQSMSLPPARPRAGTRLDVRLGVRERARGCARGPPDAASIPLLGRAAVVIRGTRST